MTIFTNKKGIAISIGEFIYTNKTSHAIGSAETIL
jgi:hypothetical protein